MNVVAANGVHNLRKNRPFLLHMANFSDRAVTLHKHTIVARVLPGQANPIATSILLSEVLNVEDVSKKNNLSPEETINVEDVKDESSLSEVNERQSPEETRPLELSEEVANMNLKNVPQEYHAKVKTMLNKHSQMWTGRLGRIELTSHRITLKPDAVPVKQAPYRAGPRGRQNETEQVKAMLKEGVIAPSESEWASPVVLVSKSDGTLRFCVDYRRLNALTLRDSYPIPRMDECMDSLGEARIFTTLDANCGYWQIPCLLYTSPSPRDA